MYRFSSGKKHYEMSRDENNDTRCFPGIVSILLIVVIFVLFSSLLYVVYLGLDLLVKSIGVSVVSIVSFVVVTFLLLPLLKKR